ncbi:HdeD family acid-resistance protein [Amycolatopsis alkalitolerans]|uniref:DUF308 domain-containing protein n=1 Tax=Amycolatopsis alkalitolerans TaxID=2547244 RepID=A0A5C4M8B4_9PSEU|nr:DUF308 domain-containing protein [Amycolatopsis alkalitolerans]TNC29123.1 DUF308 domain-containing protein [Amycolatopsis alkalitolerans]
MTYADPATGRTRSPILTATATVRWWVLLTIGIAWLVFGMMVLQFDLTSARSIALVTGLMLIVAAFSQLADVAAARGHRVVHAVLAGILFTGGLIALVWPDPTFLALARLIAWLLLFKGCANIVVALLLYGSGALWWLLLGLGAVEIVVAFWAAGVPSRSATLLVLWVGLTALTKGVADIVLAFGIRTWERAPAGP